LNSVKKNHTFEIEKNYNFETVVDLNRYLEAILSAERTVAKGAVESPDGIYWIDELQDTPDLSFYSGSAGILYFYTKLYNVLKDDKYKIIVEKSAEYLSKHWRDFELAKLFEGLEGGEKGFYGGLVALPVALIEAYKITGNSDLKKLIKDAVRDIFHAVIESAHKDENGTYWNGNPAVIYDGGVLLELIDIEDFINEDSIKDLVVSVADYILSTGYEGKNGGLVFDGYKGQTGYVAPNFEFGSAGTGYVFLRVYEYTGDKKYLDAAYKCAEFLDNISINQNKGRLIPYRYGKTDRTIFYLGACHGPAGTCKFYYKLYEVTGDKKYLDAVYELADGLESLGGPVRMSAGLWNCVNLCCGAAGHVQFFIGLYLSTSDERWLSLARKSAGVILGEAEKDEDGNVFWPIALARINPEDYTAPLGYYDGQTGIISALLQIYALEKNEFSWSRLADDPFETSIRKD
jgi:lantibiotic modifying enzyme